MLSIEQSIFFKTNINSHYSPLRYGYFKNNVNFHEKKELPFDTFQMSIFYNATKNLYYQLTKNEIV